MTERIPARSGAAEADQKGAQKQHVDMYRKILLRRQLLDALGDTRGAAYVPFIGDGDIAAEVYANRFIIFGADLDPSRVATASARLPHSKVIVADCDGWPFPGLEREFAVADLDAYSYPYDAFRSFWRNANLASRCVILFTDGERQAISLSLPVNEVATALVKPNLMPGDVIAGPMVVVGWEYDADTYSDVPQMLVDCAQVLRTAAKVKVRRG